LARYSPGLNIIDVIWVIMKRHVNPQHPKNSSELKAVLIDVCDNLTLVLINGLATQIPTRMAKVIAEDAQTMRHLCRKNQFLGD
jgi:hypothetical protein